MKVLLISGSFPPMKCGVGDYTALLAKALGGIVGTTVAVLTHVEGSMKPVESNVELFPIAHGWKISDAAPILRTVREWRPNLVHVQYPGRGYGGRILPWLLPTLARLTGIPVVLTWHEYYTRGGKRELLNAILPGGLVVVRPNYKATMPSWFRWLIRHKRFQFIPNASPIPAAKLSDMERHALRERFTSKAVHLIAYFGFVSPAKGVDFLFEIADPTDHYLVLICELNPATLYDRSILDRIDHGPWADRVTVTGFLPAEEVGRLLAAADAVVFPFRDGGGMWNTSIKSATVQGTFVLTTSQDRHGYDAAEHIYYARPDDIADMRQALRLYLGRRAGENVAAQGSDWSLIAEAHIQLYRSLLGPGMGWAARDTT